MSDQCKDSQSGCRQTNLTECLTGASIQPTSKRVIVSDEDKCPELLANVESAVLTSKDGEVKFSDGSASLPINLANMLRENAIAADSIVATHPDGTLVRFKGNDDATDYILIYRDGNAEWTPIGAKDHCFALQSLEDEGEARIAVFRAQAGAEFGDQCNNPSGTACLGFLASGPGNCGFLKPNMTYGTAPVEGSIVLWPGNVGNIPDGWFFCNGQALEQAKYPALFSVIGTNYGGVAPFFNVPDLRNRIVMGVGGTHAPTAGDTGGIDTHNIAIPVPEHTHPVTSMVVFEESTGEGSGGLQGAVATTPDGGQIDVIANSAVSVAIGNAGTPGASINFDNKPEYTGLIHIIAAGCVVDCP